MLSELKTLVATCDNCGHNQQFVSIKMQYPPLWGKTIRSEHVGTRMESSMCFLCPNCVALVEMGRMKYSKETLHIFS